MKVAEVFVNIPVKSIHQAYSYHIPDELSGIDVGWRVYVPFGARRVEGFVIGVSERESEAGRPLKDIIGAIDDEAWFMPETLAVAKWMADFYMCSLAETMRLFMPGKSGIHIEVRYAAVPVRDDMDQMVQALLGVERYRRVYDLLLRDGPFKEEAIRKELPDLSDDISSILISMRRAGIVEKDYHAEKRDKGRYKQVMKLKCDVTDELLQKFSIKRVQKRLLEYLKENPQANADGIDISRLQDEGFSRAVIRALGDTGCVAIESRRVLRDSYANGIAKSEGGVLTAEQEKVLSLLLPAIDERTYHGFLLYGVTGSGKTRVYLEAAERCIRTGRRAIVLVPEIALTGQLVMSFKSRFAEGIVVMHSRLTLSERNDAVLRVRRGYAHIIIGARSALFVPISDVGLIILDEEQDMSYKQDESPRYHVKAVAKKMAELFGAVLLLGSATPSLESYAMALAGKLELLKMPHRIGNIPLPSILCADMRKELKCGNRNILSNALHSLIADTLKDHKQMILLLNRRGYSTFIICRSCGEVIKCHSCGLPMVYHKDGRLMCHHCDEHAEVPDVCPKCGSRYIRYFGSGTEKLQEELKKQFPDARVIRMDRDTTGRKFSHQEILDAFRAGKYDILLGTQMVAKGHDVPNVTSVGIISADSCLNMPDFRAAERCFMLITQAAGRAGRHGEGGRVVVQSYSPEHYAVQAALAQDYETFARQELNVRKSLFYPPFSRLVKLMFHDENEEIARRAAEDFAREARKTFTLRNKEDGRTEIIGPAPAMISNFRGIYRFVLLIKTNCLGAVSAFMREHEMHVRTDVAIDIDPIQTT